MGKSTVTPKLYKQTRAYLAGIAQNCSANNKLLMLTVLYPKYYV